MADYKFQLVNYENKIADSSVLFNRPFVDVDSSFDADAKRFYPGPQLETAMNTAIAVGEPLLITGEPGTGKTQAAYYVAYKLSIEPVIHFQVKSDSTARDLLYNFDTVGYFRDAHLEGSVKKVEKEQYIERRALWSAMTAETPRVLLIDEIDKAPRDFPNDLLHELDKMEFTVTETGVKISGERKMRPLVFITSNSERRLPEPFLRRCVYHNIRFTEEIARKAVDNRMAQYKNLNEDFIKLAIERFMALRNLSFRKKPSTSELLVWLRVLSLAEETNITKLPDKLSALPHLDVLLKDRQDQELVKNA
jgi:MoxR-like ATPase